MTEEPLKAYNLFLKVLREHQPVLLGRCEAKDPLEGERLSNRKIAEYLMDNPKAEFEWAQLRAADSDKPVIHWKDAPEPQQLPR
ncbi:hypothetical protein [Sinomonas mesophila]|uniref:hypothetical protein n=1 Tax=Sinomonas mesophila TaxID=1531955 RepID=UPI001C379FE5|nr:hypothetical protein [Sinomonas mesophila]